MKPLKLALALLLLQALVPLHAQVDSLKVDLNFRIRSEMDQGYGTLIPETRKAETAVYSRARMGIDYFYDALEIKIAFQDIRTWGQANSVSKSGYYSLFEGWAKYSFKENFYIKAGRQAISYDNQRILGETDWLMQSRRLDALRAGYAFSRGSKLEAVVTYNNDSDDTNETFPNEFYTIIDGGERTKSLQVVHFQTRLSPKTDFSAIALNNVVQKNDGRHNMAATAGLNITSRASDRLTVLVYGYFQFGKNTADQKKAAYNTSLDVNYKANSFWNINPGLEVLSGTAYDEDADKNHSFSPYYGTNHKFNGFMDYFYMGNHYNTVGLNDYYLKNTFYLSTTGNLYLDVHYFAANAAIAPGTGRYLGTEIDLLYTKKVSKQFLLSVGYSQMFASEGMEIVKEVPNPQRFQGWAWVGLQFNGLAKLK